MTHTVSIFLTVFLAFWRYDVLKSGRGNGKDGSSQQRCVRTIVAIYLGSILLCIPSFVTYGIEQEEIKGDSLAPASSDYVIYKVNLTPIAKHYDGLFHKVSPSLSNHKMLLIIDACSLHTAFCQLVHAHMMS